MPRTAAAMAAGTITRAHAERLAWAAGDSRGEAFAPAEQTLVGLAASLDGRAFDRAVRSWAQRADDDRAEADARADHDARWSALSQTLDGRWRIDGHLTRTAGAEVATALHRICDELFAADWQRARQRLGRAPTAADLERTPAQRRHDALVVMARRAHAAPPGARLPQPLITIHVDDHTVRGRLCELADGTVLTPGELLPLFTIGDLERAVFESPDRIRLSEKTRLFRGAERRAVEIRDRYCTFDGCHVPADQCDVDHITPYEHGGLTRQDNGRLRCATHHPGRRRHQPWLADRPDPRGPDPPDTS
jgi:hypothetical protein